MFEYHEPNLTVDADGVSVTVALAEPLDIEQPLADLDLSDAQVVYAEQSVVDAHFIPDAIEQDLVETEPDERWWWRKHFLNGYAPMEELNEGPDGGDGNEEVLARVVPYLELGFHGLLKFCKDENRGLRIVLHEIQQRAEVIQEQIDEQKALEAAELERVMPKRNTSIAYKEFKHFIDEHLVELQPNGTYFWKEVAGKRLVFYQSPGGVGFGDENGEWLSTDSEIRFTQEFTPEKWNDHMGEVTVSDRGYFTASKKTTLDEIFNNSGWERQDFPTVEEALESLIPFVLEGEKDSSFGLLDSTVRGTEFSDEEDLES